MMDFSAIVLLSIAMITGMIMGVGGPGGTMLLASFYLLTSLKPSNIAGTSSAIIFLASIGVCTSYLRSGDIDWRIVLGLAPTTLVGSQFGVRLGAYIPQQYFGYLIALLLVIVGASVVYRELREIEPMAIDTETYGGMIIIGLLGFVVGITGGILGIGGAAISVPVMITLGISPLIAIGSGLTQGLFTTSSTAAGYILQNSVNWEMVVMIGGPFLVMNLVGWYIAQYIDTDRIVLALGVIMVVSAPIVVI